MWQRMASADVFALCSPGSCGLSNKLCTNHGAKVPYAYENRIVTFQCVSLLERLTLASQEIGSASCQKLGVVFELELFEVALVKGNPAAN
jgi:hypothetical protein